MTGNTPYGTGNATCTGKVFFGDITGTRAAKAGLPYPQTYFTLVLLQNTTHNTSNVIF
jgi:hypothetical protein